MNRTTLEKMIGIVQANKQTLSEEYLCSLDDAMTNDATATGVDSFDGFAYFFKDVAACVTDAQLRIMLEAYMRGGVYAAFTAIPDLPRESLKQSYDYIWNPRYNRFSKKEYLFLQAHATWI